MTLNETPAALLDTRVLEYVSDDVVLPCQVQEDSEDTAVIKIIRAIMDDAVHILLAASAGKTRNKLRYRDVVDTAGWIDDRSKNPPIGLTWSSCCYALGMDPETARSRLKKRLREIRNRRQQCNRKHTETESAMRA